MATGYQIQEIAMHPKPRSTETVGEPPSPTVQPIILKSFLQKKGKRFKGWHQRYFEIQRSHMYYYKNSSKADCLGEIDLSKCIDCKISTEASFGASFEIHTPLRTHLLSARSKEERDQWIQTINTQMEMSSSFVEQKISESKPKRWKTFRNPFKLPRQPNTKVKNRKTIMEKLRFKKSRQPAHLRVRKESATGPEFHSNRPLSMIEDETPNIDYLEALLDVNPCRSLPATPLSRKRSDVYHHPEIPDLESPFPSVSETAISDDDVLHDIPGDNDITISNHSLDSNKELNSETPVNKLNTVTEVTVKGNTWDEVREFLQQNSDSTLSLPSDILSSDDQIWMKQSCGVEQLRVFLTVCD